MSGRFVGNAIKVARTTGGRRVVLEGTRAFQISAKCQDANEDLMGRIKTELKNAMRSKNSFKSTVLRGLLSEHQYAEKSGNPNAANLASILQKAMSKRQESSRQFRAAKPAREDLAEKEDREASFIQEFLPKQMPIEELESIIGQVIEEVQKSGTSGKKVIGEVMKGVAAKVDKSRAPNSVISEIVRKLLPRE